MLKLLSPAKINLFLRIVNKRPDGYHNLSSLFQTIDLADTLSFEFHSTDILTCTDAELSVDANNLVLKALRLFRQKTGFSKNLKIHLEKKIPMQAGLGGGSSNAATTLWALNQLSNLEISNQQLGEWGAEIGSDVAFFLSCGTAYCTGRGEIIQEINTLPSQSLWIVKPAINQSTPAVFKQLKVSTEAETNQDLEAILTQKFAYFNDLEKPVFEINPALNELKHYLYSCGFKTVLLCGSGSSFFCLGSGQLPLSDDITVYKANFINRTQACWYQSNY